MVDSIAILDFGSQYAQLIARRIREAQVYCELFPWDSSVDQVMGINPRGFILSGGPASVYTRNAPNIPGYVLESGLPVLGICYGLQALTHALGGRVAPAVEREYGPADLVTTISNPLLEAGSHRVWMSHGDRVEQPPAGFQVLARSDNSPAAFIGDLERGYFGVQFHPEVRHTPRGEVFLQRFFLEVCGARPDWTPESILQQSIHRVRQQVGNGRVLAGVSGGVDSSVAAALVHQAVGDQLVPVFVDNGLLREGESRQVLSAFQQNLGMELVVVDAREEFLTRLAGVMEPEEKRKVIGETFIRVFENRATKLGQPDFLVQGTIYPDVVESRAADRSKVERIKTHHNVGGLPPDLQFELVEPLRYLFKDEVRQVGEALGLPRELVWRQPFPGPGLAVRCLGEVTRDRLARLRAADEILIAELRQAGLLVLEQKGDELRGTAQAFAVLLPVRSVGVMGDQRTYQEVIALRAVTTEDFMTADWARLPHDLLARVANRIVNEVQGVNRVVYDITSKPPATIEWE
ncbi:MAG: glutamine-hydrolyzing GMP synthase [Chloroflexota bacterium]|nr:MAG: glutamine-hydrolyzing GMP synthase [Chloroflexota bacterium]